MSQLPIFLRAVGSQGVIRQGPQGPQIEPAILPNIYTPTLQRSCGDLLRIRLPIQRVAFLIYDPAPLSGAYLRDTHVHFHASTSFTSSLQSTHMLSPGGSSSSTWMFFNR